MTNFGYTNNVPNPPNNPSVDVPNMQINTLAVENILAQDHVTFRADNGGTHLQQTYAGFSAGTLLGGAAASTAYPAAGTAITTAAQYWFSNPLGDFILSPFRAMAAVRGSDGLILNQDGNVVSVTKTVTGYNVVIRPNIVGPVDATHSYGILVSNTLAGGISPIPIYNITSATTFTLNFNFTNGSNFPTQFSFIVFQV